MAFTYNSSSSLLKTISSGIYETEWTPATASGSYDQWTNPDNALTDNTATAYAAQSGAAYKWESYHDFGFAIPTDATILGIQVRYRHYESSIDPLDGGLSLNIIKPSSVSQQRESALSTTVITNTLGSATDSWSFASITPTEINSDAFTVDVGVYSYISKIITASLEYLEVKITYKREAWFSGNTNIAQVMGPYQFTSDTNLLASLSGQFTGDSNLLREMPGQFTSDTSLLKIEPETFTGNASLLTVLSGQYTGNANLFGEEELSFTSEASLKRTDVLEQFTGDANLYSEEAVIFTGNAYFYDNDSKFLYGPWIYGTIYGGTISGEERSEGLFTSNAVIVVRRDDQFTGDSSLLSVKTPGPFTGDANLERLVVAYSFTGDTFLIRTFADTFTGDSSIINVETKTFTSNASLSHPKFTSDASLRATKSETFNANALIAVQFSISYTGDATFIKERASTFTGDASLLGLNIPVQFVGNASILKTEFEQFTGNAKITITHKGLFNGDANLLVIDFAKQFSGDTNLLGTVSETFTGDASIIQIDIAGQFTGDASLKGEEETQFTGSAYFDIEKTEAFAGISTLDSPDQSTGFAGTCDCVDAARLGWGLSGMDEFGLELGI